MPSSYSTDLKLELMVTGENSGTWGDKTNTNLNLLQQAIAGYQSIALTSTNTTLSMTNATISDARNAVIKFTGTLSANSTVYVDTGIEKTYIIENGYEKNVKILVPEKEVLYLNDVLEKVNQVGSKDLSLREWSFLENVKYYYSK